MMTDWIEWSGGKCPVPPCTEIEARLRNGTRYVTCYPSLDLRWGHCDSTYDIVAYRVYNPAQPDPVNSPPHYTDGGIEAIDYIEAKLGPDGFRSYCVGNALKYISRAGKKGSAKEDLSKAIWYLRRAGGD